MTTEDRAESAQKVERSPPEGFPPCPGCDSVGFDVQEWVGEEQVKLWHCDADSCRVETYRPRDCDPYDKPGGDWV